ncbi:MAG: hypothetical protein KGJ00_22225 [Bradyrhizobium sp.]|nr:hypothetical protein [Bradyrhizobium sp.]
MYTAFAIAGAVINFAGGLSYVRAILKGEAAPNRVTWFLWAFVPLIAGLAQLRSGVGISTLVVMSVGASPACVVIASFVAGTGSWKLGPFDYVCGACALAALALWAVTGDPVTAIVLSIVGDAAAALPTLRKAWIAPATEDRLAYLISFVGMIAGILSIREATFSAYAFNVYLLIASGALVLILYLPRASSHTEPTT